MFTHLSVRSFHSFGRGTSSVENLCARARKLGFRQLALTDTNGLYAIGWFFKACTENGITPIIGAELLHPRGRAILLPYTRQGYSHLCHTISARHLDDGFTPADAIARWRDGVVVISDDRSLLAAIAKRCGVEDLYVELRPARRRSEAVAFSRTSGIPLLVTGDVHFLEPRDYDLHVKLRAISLRKTLKTVPATELAAPACWLTSPQEIEDEFASFPEALSNADRVAVQCAALGLTFDTPIFPRYISPDGRSTGDVLRELATTAVRRRYCGSREVMERLDTELEIIIRKGFADTFLVMRDIVSKSEYTCGRGSAAASLVSYALDITAVDPVSCDLYFGRFLNEARTDPPDIDMDFCCDERRPVIDSIFQEGGDGKVAMVANHNCMGMRQAIRRLAELEGLPQAEISSVTRYFSGWGGSVEAFCATHPMVRGQRFPEMWRRILLDAERLVGIPTHLSLHPGGVVIASDGIDNYIPRQRSRNGLIAIQTEKDQTEDFLRFVKFDVLGNSSLCVIRDALQAIRDEYGVEIDYRDWRRFASDSKTREVISEARTMACFHIESASFLQLLEKIGPGLREAGPQRIFDVLVILSSIIRPASNGNIKEFLRRFFGGSFEYLHPDLEPILGETLGLPVYQEHVNLMAMTLAGFSEVEADRLRKALTGKKSESRIHELIGNYIQGCIRNGVPEEAARKTADQILQFVHYSFLKAHSASYVILALACTYLKTHYPAIFMASRLSEPGGFWSFRAYLSECERLGVRILMPDINESEARCTARANAIRIGLMRITGISSEIRETIVKERRTNGAFTSLPDFWQRVPVAEDEMERLIMAGIFDCLEPDLTQGAMHYLYAQWAGLGRPGMAAMGADDRHFGGYCTLAGGYDAQRERARATCRPYTDAEKMQNEVESLGTLVSQHPLERYRQAISRTDRVVARELRGFAGRSVTLVGWPIASKEVTTVKDEPMEFWAFEDETGIFHAILFPRVYERFCRLLIGEWPLLISGQVQQDYSAVTVNVRSIMRLSESSPLTTGNVGRSEPTPLT